MGFIGNEEKASHDWKFFIALAIAYVCSKVLMACHDRIGLSRFLASLMQNNFQLLHDIGV
jgi:hypothetical protein